MRVYPVRHVHPVILEHQVYIWVSVLDVTVTDIQTNVTAIEEYAITANMAPVVCPNYHNLSHNCHNIMSHLLFS